MKEFSKEYFDGFEPETEKKTSPLSGMMPKKNSNTLTSDLPSGDLELFPELLTALDPMPEGLRLGNSSKSLSSAEGEEKPHKKLLKRRKKEKAQKREFKAKTAHQPTLQTNLIDLTSEEVISSSQEVVHSHHDLAPTIFPAPLFYPPPPPIIPFPLRHMPMRMAPFIHPILPFSGDDTPFRFFFQNSHELYSPPLQMQSHPPFPILNYQLGMLLNQYNPGITPLPPQVCERLGMLQRLEPITALEEKEKKSTRDAVFATNQEKARLLVDKIRGLGQILNEPQIQQLLSITDHPDFENILSTLDQCFLGLKQLDFSFAQIFHLATTHEAAGKLWKLNIHGSELRATGFTNKQIFDVTSSRDGLKKISTLLEYRFQIIEQNMSREDITEILKQENSGENFLLFMRQLSNNFHFQRSISPTRIGWNSAALFNSRQGPPITRPQSLPRSWFESCQLHTSIAQELVDPACEAAPISKIPEDIKPRK